MSLPTKYKTVIEPQSGWQVINWKEIAEYRDLLFFLVLRDVKVLYKQTVLGFGWAILRPVISMVVFTVIFGKLAKVPSDGIPYPIFSYAALLPWTYFSTSLTNSTQSLVTNAKMFTKVYFPRLVIPMTPVIAGLVDFVLAAVILGIMMVYYQIVPTWQIVYLPLLILMMILTAAGAGMWLSVLALQYRDFKYGMQFMVQLLMYGAPVVWPVSLIPPEYHFCYGLYPMAGVIEGFRACLLGTAEMPWALISAGLISSALLVVTGAFYFRRRERYFADVA